MFFHKTTKRKKIVHLTALHKAKKKNRSRYQKKWFFLSLSTFGWNGFTIFVFPDDKQKRNERKKLQRNKTDKKKIIYKTNAKTKTHTKYTITHTHTEIVNENI